MAKTEKTGLHGGWFYFANGEWRFYITVERQVIVHKKQPSGVFEFSGTRKAQGYEWDLWQALEAKEKR